MDPLAAFEPTRTRPWDRRTARHLLERAGFGGTAAEVDELVALGPSEAVASLVDYPPPAAPPVPEFLSYEPLDVAALRGLTENERRIAVLDLQRRLREGVRDLKAWWLERMVATTHPLEEKLVLFWHGHFAVEAQKVKNPLALFTHYEMLRHHARGAFGDFLLAVSHDPAMLIYLDNQLNQAGRPNENYARELFELFSLGIGHYTEDDVRESARAFTGWSVSGLRPGQAGAPSFQFLPRLHDDGDKTVLGVTGRLDGGDVVDIILDQPACATFLCGKLFRYFVADTITTDDEPFINGLADQWRDSGYQTQPLLRALFASEMFYDDRRIGAQIKSPVQLVVGTLRRLGGAPPLAMRGLLFALDSLGQNLFDPPNVAGWPGGEEWINTSTLLGRYNLLGQLAGGGRRAMPIDWGRLGLAFASDGREMARALGESMLAAPLEEEPLTALADYLDQALRRGGAEEARRLGLHLIGSSPNYQVC